MVPICRGAPFLLVTDVVKALPSRQPETKAAQNATAMMGHPTRQIQQGPIGCPTCGHAHRTGTVCSAMKSVDGAFLDDLFGKGVMTISGQKRGNPYRDEGTGRFAASPQGGAGGGGAAGGGEPTQENTVMGARPRPAAASPSENIGTANTMEAPAPSGGTTPGVGGAPTPPAQAAGGATMAGKVNAKPAAPKNQTGITPSMIADYDKQQAEDQAFLDKLLAKPQPETPAGPKNVFSHAGAQNAYSAAKEQAMGAGSSPDEAHAAGMKAGGQVYADSIRDPNAAPPSAHGPQQSPPTRSAPNVMPGARATSMPTTPGGPATAPGGGAPTSAGTMPNMPAPSMPGGGGSAPAAPGAPATPAAPGGGGTPAPKAPKAAGGGKQQGFLEGLVKPWEHAAHGMGAGLATPGGTIGATNSAVTGTAHGLLHHQNEQKPASQQHQQKVQSAQKQPGAMANQQTNHLNSMRQFAGQAGPGGSGMPGGTP